MTRLDVPAPDFHAAYLESQDLVETAHAVIVREIKASLAAGDYKPNIDLIAKRIVESGDLDRDF